VLGQPAFQRDPLHAVGRDGHRQRSAIGESVIFAVGDNGQGIPEELRPRIFERFVKGPGSPARDSGWQSPKMS